MDPSIVSCSNWETEVLVSVSTVIVAHFVACIALINAPLVK